MSIVNWTTDNIDLEELESSEEATMALLKMSPEDLSNRWKGRLLVKPRGQPKISVELRKQISGTNIVIKIYDTPPTLRAKDQSLVRMSMSAGVRFTEDDLNIMNLAIAEGIEVYRMPAHWVKLNKYLDESNGRQQRRTDGKFVKETI